MSSVGNIWDGGQSELSEVMVARMASPNSEHIRGTLGVPAVLLSPSRTSTHWTFTATLRRTTVIPGLQLGKQWDNLPKAAQFVSRGTGVQPTETGSIQTSWQHLESLAVSSRWWETGQQLNASCGFRRRSPGFHGMQKWSHQMGKTGFVVSPTFGDLSKVMLHKSCCSVLSGHAAHSTVSPEKEDRFNVW